ncbi:MAG: 50S ribosomal protein L35 [Candidatus Obscuribacterales bacterium]|nr:50S ribosomal protein L35 [Candidatus Obscuribacterales bacterium]
MPKMKTRKCLLRRFKVTGTGKVLRHKAGKSHRMCTFTGKRVRQLRREAQVPTIRAKKIKRALLLG